MIAIIKWCKTFLGCGAVLILVACSHTSPSESGVSEQADGTPVSAGVGEILVCNWTSIDVQLDICGQIVYVKQGASAHIALTQDLSGTISAQGFSTCQDNGISDVRLIPGYRYTINLGYWGSDRVIMLGIDAVTPGMNVYQVGDPMPYYNAFLKQFGYMSLDTSTYVWL